MKKFSSFIRSSLVVIGLLVLSSCGQKGPLVLEEVPVDKTQQPLENTPDAIPLEQEDAVEEGSEPSSGD